MVGYKISITTSHNKSILNEFENRTKSSEEHMRPAGCRLVITGLEKSVN